MYYKEVLDGMADSCREIFGEGLTGVYLHGSMVMGCFHPVKSDIDLIVVVHGDITDGQKMRFMEVVAALDRQAPAKGIELSVVKEEYCRDFVYPTPYELHFSRMHLRWFRENPEDYISRMKGTDRDLAAHFTIIKRYGEVLYGAAVEEVFGEVPRESYLDSIWADIEGAGEEILGNPVYVVLNLCRVAAFLEDGLVSSKKQGGEWGMENLASGYRGLVSSALECYVSGEEMAVDEEEALRFGREMVGYIKRMMQAGGR